MNSARNLEPSGFGNRAHALYVVLIAFGLERLVEGAYAVWFSPQTASPLKHPANLVVLLSVVMWGARLFWSATNIERYAKRDDVPNHTKAARVIGIHFPILLGQSAIFFWVCESYRTSVVPLLTNNAVSGASAEQFALLVIVSLVYNSAWLITLVWPVAPRGAPEIEWIGNNVLFAGLIALAIALVVLVPIPDPSHSISIYGGLLLINSIVDFRMTRKVYLES